VSDGAQRSSSYRLSQLRLIEQPLPEVLATVIDIARGATEGCDEAGLALDDLAVAPASTGAAAAALDVGQREMDEGPCATSLRSGTVEKFDAAADDPRWPRFAKLARQHGVGSCLAVPLVTGRHTIGVLNLYSRVAGGIGRLGRQTAIAFAEQASFLVANFQDYAELLRVTERLRQVLAGPEDIVAEATGVLMARHELSPGAARSRLEDEADHGGRSIVDRAQGIVDSTG